MAAKPVGNAGSKQIEHPTTPRRKSPTTLFIFLRMPPWRLGALVSPRLPTSLLLFLGKGCEPLIIRRERGRRRGGGTINDDGGAVGPRVGPNGSLARDLLVVFCVVTVNETHSD